MKTIARFRMVTMTKLQNDSVEQQLVDMAEEETDPFVKKVLLRMACNKMAEDAWRETHGGKLP